VGERGKREGMRERGRDCRVRKVKVVLTLEILSGK
jgi:hypothetical protein